MTAELTGPELDAAVARAVFGLRRTSGDQSMYTHREIIEAVLEGRRPDESKITFAHLPTDWSPSTDMAAAWTVVEAMRAKGYHAALLSKHDGWRAEFAPKGCGQLFRIDAETAPLAICEAAIAAMGDQS